MRKLTIRLEDDLHDMLSMVTAVQGVSIQSYIEELIEQAVGEEVQRPEVKDAVRDRLERQRDAFGL